MEKRNLPVTSSENEAVPLSGERFLSALEERMGGKLYFSLSPKANQALANIEPRIGDAFDTLSVNSASQKREVEDPYDQNQNVADTFLQYVFDNTFHGSSSTDFVHMLADPICRSTLSESLEIFFRACLPDPIDEPLLEDTLPFRFTDVIFDTALPVQTLDEYLSIVKYRGYGLGELLGDLDAEHRNEIQRRYPDEFRKAMETLTWVIRLQQVRKTFDVFPQATKIAGDILNAFHQK